MLTKSEDNQSTSLKRYKTINPSTGLIVSVQFNPKEPAYKNVDFVQTLSMLLATASNIPSLTVAQSSMLSIGLQANNVTIQEAMQSFWKAYGDPYVSGGRIEFRHLMKYITEARELASNPRYSYETIIGMVNKAEAVFSEFLCLNGENGTERVEGKNGKPLWVRKKSEDL